MKIAITITITITMSSMTCQSQISAQHLGSRTACGTGGVVNNNAQPSAERSLQWQPRVDCCAHTAVGSAGHLRPVLINVVGSRRWNVRVLVVPSTILCTRRVMEVCVVGASPQASDRDCCGDSVGAHLHLRRAISVCNAGPCIAGQRRESARIMSNNWWCGACFEFRYY